MEQRTHNHPDDTSDLLSAYIDNAVDVTERRRVDELRRTCSACAQELGELRTVKALMSDLPLAQPRRSFTIDPATAPRPRWLLFPTLRIASLVASLLLLVLVGVNVTSLGGAGQSSSASAPMANERSRSTLSAPFGADSNSDTTGGAAAASTESMAAAEAPEASAAASTAASENAQASTAAGTPPESALVPPSAAASAEASGVAKSSAEPTAIAEAVPPDAGAAGAAQSGDQAAGSQADAQNSTLSANAPSSPDTVDDDGSVGGETLFTTLQIATALVAIVTLALLGATVWARQRGL